MKIGTTDFNVESIKAMSYDEFEQIYKGKLKGNLQEIYKKLGGKIEAKPTRKKKEEDVGEA